MAPALPVVDLLERVRHGDGIAAHELSRRIEPFLRSLARRCLNSGLRRQVDSTDLAQSAFRRILAGAMRARFEDETRALGWMAAIIRNRVRSLARHPEDRGGAALDAGLEPPASDDPAQWADDAEQVLRFQHALGTLSGRERQVVLLRDFQEMEWRQVGETAGCSPEAARKLHDRALDRLRALLGSP